MEVSTILIALFAYVGVLSLLYFRNNKLYSCLIVCSTTVLCLSSNWICQTAAKIPNLLASIKEWINHLPLINISFNGHSIERVPVLAFVFIGLFLVTSISAIIYGEFCEERLKKKMLKYENGSNFLNE
jgi:uncharacterized membrane protein